MTRTARVVGCEGDQQVESISGKEGSRHESDEAWKRLCIWESKYSFLFPLSNGRQTR